MDIDWEYPKNDAEAKNFLWLLEATRTVGLSLRSSEQRLNVTGTRFSLLSWQQPYAPDGSLSGRLSSKFDLILAVALLMYLGAQNYDKMHLKEMDRYLDFWNLMAYDYSGSWDQNAGHQANLHHSHHDPMSTPFSTSSALRHYKSKGIATSKIVLGMPLYGRAFASTDGPGKPFSGTGEGSWEPGVWDFKVLPQEGAKEQIDHQSGASWSYDADKRLMVSYDNLELAKAKARYVKEEGLGGTMWWESSGDKQGDDGIISKVRPSSSGS